MAGRIARAVMDSLRGIGAAVGARPATFLGAAGAVAVLSVVLPPLVLSVARKPVDYFTFNPWLKRLPEYLASAVPFGQKLEKLPALALFWFSSDNPYGTEWGFAVDVRDLLRILATSLLFGAYFALWRSARDPAGRVGPRLAVGRPGGVAGAFVSLFGLSTGPCSVMGCGAPVLPVVGLAFAGLSSGTLKLLADVSTIATSLVLVALIAGVGYLGWVVGTARAVPRDPLLARGAGAARARLLEGAPQEHRSESSRRGGARAPAPQDPPLTSPDSVGRPRA